MNAGQFLMLTLIFPSMCLLLFAVVQVEKRQFGAGQGSGAPRRTAGDQPPVTTLMERRRSRGRHARALPDGTARHWPPVFAGAAPGGTGTACGWRHRDVQAIILHVITETEAHAGHLDAARELLDGPYLDGPAEHAIPRG
jgi:hypothetical protein